MAEPKVVHGPEPQYSLTNFLIQQGKNPGWEVISAQWCTPLPAITDRLQLARNVEVFCFRRLRLSDTEPIGYLESFVSHAFRDAIDEQDYETGGSLEYLKSKGHLVNSRALRNLEAVPAQELEASLLGVDIGAPMLQVRRLVISRDDLPIEDFRGIYRGDRFQYQISSLPAEITQIMKNDR